MAKFDDIKVSIKISFWQALKMHLAGISGCPVEQVIEHVPAGKKYILLLGDKDYYPSKQHMVGLLDNFTKFLNGKKKVFVCNGNFLKKILVVE